jgi:GC-rich sequence DNA-binding factor
VQDLDQQETDLRNEVERVSRKMEWFDSLRNWVEDIAAFLDAKQPALEQIAKEHVALQKERIDIISRRRFQDDADDIALFTGSPVTAEFDSTSIEEELAEEERLRAQAPHSGVRQSRRSARALRRTLSAVLQSKEDGYATDDDLPPEESQDLLLALTRLQSTSERLFEDVGSEEFRDPEIGILPRFKEWRALHEEEYSKSYGGFVLVNVWEFWARAEMLGWNPFQVGGTFLLQLCTHTSE